MATAIVLRIGKQEGVVGGTDYPNSQVLPAVEFSMAM